MPIASSGDGFFGKVSFNSFVQASVSVGLQHKMMILAEARLEVGALNMKSSDSLTTTGFFWPSMTVNSEIASRFKSQETK